MTNELPRIAFFDTKAYDRMFFDQANQNYGYEIKYFESRLSPETAAMSYKFDVACVFVNDIVSRESIDILVENGIKLLALRCAGYNNVDLRAAFQRLDIVRVPAYSPYAVAEHAVAMLMTLNRKTHRAYYRIRDNNFAINGLLGFDIHGKTVGIIGTGKIGKVFAQIMHGFGARVLAHDAFPDNDFAEQNQIEYTDLPALYRQSDIISLHCPLTPETHYMIDDQAISMLKPGAIIVNTSRGQLIDTSALIEGLKIGIVGGAALDVYEEEGDFFFEDLSDSVVTDDILARLTTFNNVLITSHQGFFTREALTAIATTTLQNIDDFSHGKGLKNGICWQCDSKTSCHK